MKKMLSTLFSTSLLVGVISTTTFAQAEDEINVVLFGMPYTNGFTSHSW